MKIFALFLTLLFASTVSAQTFSAAKYYQLADGNEWRYTAPPGWKDGDYISLIKIEMKGFAHLYQTDEKTENSYRIENSNSNKSFQSYKHYDATKAAKLLVQNNFGIYLIGEEFAGSESIARFDVPILWFPAKLKVGDTIDAKSGFTRTYKDGKTTRGMFEIKQKIAAVEDVTVTAGKFKKCLRVESETFWELGDGRKARSINVYHYAPKVGVIKASARFIVMNEQGRELINRLVETDLKSATVNGRQIKVGRS